MGDTQADGLMCDSIAGLIMSTDVGREDIRPHINSYTDRDLISIIAPVVHDLVMPARYELFSRGIVVLTKFFPMLGEQFRIAQLMRTRAMRMVDKTRIEMLENIIPHDDDYIFIAHGLLSYLSRRNEIQIDDIFDDRPDFLSYLMGEPLFFVLRSGASVGALPRDFGSMDIHPDKVQKALIHVIDVHHSRGNPTFSREQSHL